jgi:hypothetical protein
VLLVSERNWGQMVGVDGVSSSYFAAAERAGSLRGPLTQVLIGEKSALGRPLLAGGGTTIVVVIAGVPGVIRILRG